MPRPTLLLATLVLVDCRSRGCSDGGASPLVPLQLCRSGPAEWNHLGCWDWGWRGWLWLNRLVRWGGRWRSSSLCW